MSLSKLLTPGQIVVDMKSSERWSAITELVDVLVREGRIKDGEDKESIIRDLKKREESMSTGIGYGVAIPHTSSERVSEVVAAFGKSLGGIEFEALDAAPVHFVVLFIVPKDEFQTHLRMLASIAKFLNDRAVRQRLTEAATAEEILAIFSESGPAKQPNP